VRTLDRLWRRCLPVRICNSKRYPALLRYVVEQTLAGQATGLKERTIGIEVFGRMPTYDTNTDTVVRYTAGEVRKRLSLLHHEVPDSRIQIHLSARSYQPELLARKQEEEMSEFEIKAASFRRRQGRDGHLAVPAHLLVAQFKPQKLMWLWRED
jgi:hypothetical protein